MLLKLFNRDLNKLTAMGDENLDKEFERIESQVGQDQQEAENIEHDIEDKESQIESEEQSSASEIQDAEQNGNQRELVDAENKTEEELQEESQTEEEIEQVEEDIMEEINLEEKQEQLLEKMQKNTRTEFKDALSSLKQEKKKLLNAKNSESTQIIPQDYQNIEEVLNEFRDAAGNVHRFTRELEEILQEIGRTRDEEDYLENLTSHLPEELGFMENEVKELMSDFSKLQDSKHAKMAQREGEQLQQLEQREQKLEQMEQRIDQELQSELQEAENLVREDEQMIELIDQSISELNELYEILEQEKNIWRFALNQNPPLKDVENTINMLNKVIGEDESELQRAGNFASNLLKNTPSGPSVKAGAGQTARASITTAKYLLLAAIFVALAGWMYVSGTT